MAPAGTSSSLMLDEYFEAGDPRFLDELLGSNAEKKLKALGERWTKDQRPFARRVLLRYIDDGCDRPHHRALVKKLFKTAEEKGDDELMAHFLAAFDRLIQRKLVTRDRYDWSIREIVHVQALQEDAAIPARVRSAKPGVGHGSGRFTRATRRYLRRRAFRYFRKLGYKDIARYGRAVRTALMLYQDEHVARTEQLLDAWGLVHTLYWGSSVLEREPNGVRIAQGRALAELSPAPIHPAAWKGCFEELLHMLERAGCRPVRLFALHLLERDYQSESKAILLGRIKRLLLSPHDEAQAFGAKCLRELPGLERLGIDEWLELLEVKGLDVLPIVVELVRKHVAPSRLDLEGCTKLALAQAAPVAELGVSWAKDKPIRGEGDLKTVIKMGGAPCPSVRGTALPYLGTLLEASPFAKPEHARELIDGRFEDTRKAGLLLLERDRYKDSTLLWAALSESPHDDVKAFLVSHLESREKVFAKESLLGVWASSLLAVHRGGRAKRTVLRQVTERLKQRAEEAAALVPLLAVSLRSVRAPERRGALAALGRAAYFSEALAKEIAARIPELELFSRK